MNEMINVCLEQISAVLMIVWRRISEEVFVCM